MKKSRMGYAFFGKNLESTDKKAILHDMTMFCLGKKREGPYFIFLSYSLFFIILFVGLHIRLSLSVPMSEDLCGNYIPATAHVLTGMPKMRVVWALAQQR